MPFPRRYHPLLLLSLPVLTGGAAFAAWLLLRGDGWPDIFVANDGKPIHLWMTQNDGTFPEEARARGIACNSVGQAEAIRGVALGSRSLAT